MDHYLERVVDLLDPSLNRIYNMSVEEARQRVLSDKPEAVREIEEAENWYRTIDD